MGVVPSLVKQIDNICSHVTFQGIRAVYHSIKNSNTIIGKITDAVDFLAVIAESVHLLRATVLL
jgi:hypothetical protein